MVLLGNNMGDGAADCLMAILIARCSSYGAWSSGVGLSRCCSGSTPENAFVQAQAWILSQSFYTFFMNKARQFENPHSVENTGHLLRHQELERAGNSHQERDSAVPAVEFWLHPRLCLGVRTHSCKSHTMCKVSCWGSHKMVSPYVHDDDHCCNHDNKVQQEEWD